jgi:hypothetical protein
MYGMHPARPTDPTFMARGERKTRCVSFGDNVMNNEISTREKMFAFSLERFQVWLHWCCLS